MQATTHIQLLEGRLVAVGPGLVDVTLAVRPGAVESLLSQLAFATEHRLRIEVRGSGPLGGARGRITSDFVISADGAVADHEVALSIHTPRGGPRS